MSKRTKFLLGIGVIAALVIGWQVAAFAVHDEVFELDGNAVDNPAGGQDDWSNIPGAVTANGSQNTANNPGDSTFLTEMPAGSQSIFTGGGSKDPNDLDQWRWKNGGGLPDKDNLLHAFAARYTVNGDELLYFGSDRFDNSGDAVQGFWFFQNQVSQNANGTFSGLHRDGDLLILTDFSNGGGTSIIGVYQWVNGGLSQVASSNSANCLNNNLNQPPPAGTSDLYCGIVNPASGPGITNGITPSPWTFLDKSGNTGFANGEFFEGGLNLTDLNLGDRCFSSVAAETRSSTSTTATLKDFVLGDLASCAPNMTTQANAGNTGTVTPGTAVTDTATITITGATDPDDPIGDVTFFLCGPDQDDPVTAAGCPEDANGNDTGTNIGTGTLADSSDPANTTDGIAAATSPEVNTDTSVTGELGPGEYCFRAEWPGDDNYDGFTHTNATTECFTVADTFSIETDQSFRPQDKATITTDSGDVDGSVEFKAYDSLDNCNGNDADGLLYEETVPNVTTTEVSTSNDGEDDPNTTAIDGLTVTSPGATLFWRVTYTPTDSGITGTDSVCVEDSTVTIDDDTAPPTTP